MPFGEPQIRSIVEKLGEVQEYQGPTRTDYIQDLADSIVRGYVKEVHQENGFNVSTRYINRPGKLTITEGFVQTANEVLSDEELPPVDLRIQQSAVLALYYLYFSPELRNIINKYAANRDKFDQLSDIEYSKVITDIEVEAIVRIIEKQQDKDGEKLLTERYPNAPTTGFEFEQIDLLRYITADRSLCDEKIFILNNLPHGTNNILTFLEGIKTPDTKCFTKKLSDLIQRCKNEIEVTKLIQSYLKYTTLKRKVIDKILTINTGVPSSDDHEIKYDKMIRQSALKILEQQIKETDDKGQKVSINQQIKFIKGAATLNEGHVLTKDELVAIQMLIPSVAKRISEITPISVIPELSSAEEIITRPTQSISLSLRDFLHLIKSKAIVSNFLSVHQNVAGVELTPEDSEIMEVTAILKGAEYDIRGIEPTNEELTTHRIAKRFGIPKYKEIYPKQSGKNIFPYHRSKPADMSIAYPTKKRSLVEFRSKRALDTSKDFPSHVRASTFTWLACWGKQAQQKPPEERTETEKKLAEEWDTLMANWRSLLDEKTIHQPTGEERYNELIVEDGVTYITDREKYTLYISNIELENVEDRHSQTIDRPNSMRSRSRKLITEYNKRVKKIIKY